MSKLNGIDLLKELCAIIAPSSAEAPVAEFIKKQVADSNVEITEDTVGNLVAYKKGNGKSDKKIMISAHMDEVGFTITGIDDDGRLSFSNVGGIDPSVIGGRAVVILGKSGILSGVISAIPIHLRSLEERKKLSPASELRIDIGAKDKADAKQNVSVGDVGTFRSEFTEFGDGNMLYGKAIDDRFGCALMCDIINESKDITFDYDVYFAFTTREEIGYSGALITSERIAPDLALVLESTAVADLANVPEASQVAHLSQGPAISFADRSTIYGEEIFNFILDTAKASNIKTQTKCFVSGGNDAGYVHSVGIGVVTAAISVPTRYLHSASCVIAKEDYFSTKALIKAIIESDIEKIVPERKVGAI